MLQSTAFRLYILEVISFVQSIKVKSEQSIKLSNEFLYQAGYKIGSEPSEWKFYKNIQGEYWSGNTDNNDPNFLDDKAIYFQPYDDIPSDMETTNTTPKQVLLNKANLARLPISKAELLSRGNYYKNLIDDNIESEELINGIISPVTPDQLTELINSADYTIYNYDTTFIYENETNLIPELQKRIYSYMHRWNNGQYQITDALYEAANLATFYDYLYKEVTIIHDENILTDRVNKFHLWQRLGEYFDIGNFRDRLPVKQAVWLYRNIDDIVASGGTQDIMDYLDDNFAQPYGLMLSAVDLIKNDDRSTAALRRPISPNSSVGLDIITLDELVERNRASGYGNVDFEDQILENIRKKVSKSPTKLIKTGIVECNISSTDNSGLTSKTNDKLSNWIYMATNDRYVVNQTLTIPSIGIITLDPKEALAVCLYCSAVQHDLSGYGLEDKLPSMLTGGVLNNIQNFELEDVYRLITPEFRGFVNWVDLLEEAKALDLEYSLFFNSTEFLDFVNKSTALKAKHIMLKERPGDSFGISQCENVLSHIYRPKLCTKLSKLGSDVTWEEFMNNIEFDLTKINKTSAATLFKAVIKEFVDFATVTNAIPSPHYEMIEIMRMLSSYTTTFYAGLGVTPKNPIVETSVGYQTLPSVVIGKTDIFDNTKKIVETGSTSSSAELGKDQKIITNSTETSSTVVMIENLYTTETFTSESVSNVALIQNSAQINE